MPLHIIRGDTKRYSSRIVAARRAIAAYVSDGTFVIRDGILSVRQSGARRNVARDLRAFVLRHDEFSEDDIKRVCQGIRPLTAKKYIRDMVRVGGLKVVDGAYFVINKSVIARWRR